MINKTNQEDESGTVILLVTIFSLGLFILITLGVQLWGLILEKAFFSLVSDWAAIAAVEGFNQSPATDYTGKFVAAEQNAQRVINRNISASPFELLSSTEVTPEVNIVAGRWDFDASPGCEADGNSCFVANSDPINGTPNAFKVTLSGSFNAGKLVSAPGMQGMDIMVETDSVAAIEPSTGVVIVK